MTGHAKTTLGRLEWRIASEIGFDLYEVKRWPLEKKLAYQQHMAVEAAIKEQARNGGIDTNGVGSGMDLPDLSNVPSGGNMPSGGNAPSTGGGRGGSTESTQHPDLQRYGNLVNVRNDDSDG